jgi:hypothetical protein
MPDSTTWDCGGGTLKWLGARPFTFSQAGNMLLIERGATIAGAMKSIWIAEGKAAREMT